MGSKSTKIIILLTIFCFLQNCITERMWNVESDIQGVKWHVESDILDVKKNIYGVVNLNNDWFDFEEFPATLSDGKIRGYIRSGNEKEFVVIPVSEVKLIWTRSGSQAFEFILNLVSILGISAYTIALPVISIPIIGLILII